MAHAIARVGNLPENDLRHVLERGSPVWSDFRAARVLVTGASGFVGSWLLETLLHANDALDLRLEATALVRDGETFARLFPHLARAVRVCEADVCAADLVPGDFTHYVHCASAASPRENRERPLRVIELIEHGTARMLECAERGRDVRFLQVSSGSVYGLQPSTVERLEESYEGSADAENPAQWFGAAKRRAELRGEAAAARGVGFVAARMFGLVGPRLPLDGQFALGNFLGDALAGRPVHISGDGTPVRSWMHAADMAAWAWILLARGRAGGAYNVGSEHAISIREAAERVAALCVPPLPVVREREPASAVTPSRYVPSTRRAREELGLETWISFDHAVRRTWDWWQPARNETT